MKDALEKIMEEKAITKQKEMAEYLDISQGQVSNYMMNKSYPALRVAAVIYGRFGYQVEPYTEKALKKEWEYLKDYEGL